MKQINQKKMRHVSGGKEHTAFYLAIAYHEPMFIHTIVPLWFMTKVGQSAKLPRTMRS